jgi:hypothetical protein
VLADISWDDLAYPNFEKQPENGKPYGGSFGLLAIILGTLSEFSPSNLVLYRLWERDRCCAANNEYGILYKSYQSGRSLQEARHMARQELVTRKCDKAPGRSRDSIAEAVDHILRKGARWTDLVSAVESMEVLLVDEDRHLRDSTTTLGKVIAHGTDEEFEAMKAFLLSEENTFKECCLRLTGVQRMITDLSETRKSQTELRAYLVKAIGERIEYVFGPSGRAEDPLEEITEIKSDPLQFTIWHVLGIQIEFCNEPAPPDFGLPIGQGGKNGSRHHLSYQVLISISQNIRIFLITSP